MHTNVVRMETLMHRKPNRLLAIAVFSFAVPAIAADSVSGQFVLDGKPLKPGEVAAFHTQRYGLDGYINLVILSEKPIDKAATAAAEYAYDKVINDPALHGHDFISLFVKPSGEIYVNASVGDTQYINTTGKMGGEQGDLVGTCKQNSPTHVACSVKTAQPVKTPSGQTYTLDFTFDADISIGKS